LVSIWGHDGTIVSDFFGLQIFSLLISTCNRTYSVALVNIVSLRTVPLAWCRALHAFISLMWEPLFQCIGLTLRHQGKLLPYGYSKTCIQRFLALPLFNNRPKSAAFLNYLAYAEILICYPWAYSLGQRLEWEGPCITKNVSYDMVHYRYDHLCICTRVSPLTRHRS
jgi:hypothetical protein